MVFDLLPVENRAVFLGDVHVLLVGVWVVFFRTFKGADTGEADGSVLADVNGAEAVLSSISDDADAICEGNVYASGKGERAGYILKWIC